MCSSWFRCYSCFHMFLYNFKSPQIPRTIPGPISNEGWDRRCIKQIFHLTFSANIFSLDSYISAKEWILDTRLAFATSSMASRTNLIFARVVSASYVFVTRLIFSFGLSASDVRDPLNASSPPISYPPSNSATQRACILNDIRSWNISANHSKHLDGMFTHIASHV